MTTYAGSRSNLFINTRREQYNSNVAKDMSDFSVFTKRKEQKQAQVAPQVRTSSNNNKTVSKNTVVQKATGNNAVRNPSVKNTSVQNTVAKSTVVKNTAVKGAAIKSNTAKNTAVRSSAVKKTAVTQTAHTSVKKIDTTTRRTVQSNVAKKKAAAIAGKRPVRKNVSVKANTITVADVIRAVRENNAEKPKVKVITKVATEKRPFPATFVAYSIVFTILFMFLLISFSQINEYTIKINHIKNNISEQQKEQTRLKLLIDSRDDLRYIEEEATQKLGMVKSDKLTKQYVNIAGKDKLEVTEVKRVRWIWE